MPVAPPRRSTSFAKRKPPHRIIIARGGEVRTFTLRPWLAGTVIVATALFGSLYLAATGYLFFRDDILKDSIAQQTRMKQAYEDRIATLRSDIDRLTSRQLLNQQQILADVQRLSGRQAALDARQDVIAGLSQAARRVGIAPAGNEAAAPDAAPASRQGRRCRRAVRGRRKVAARRRHHPLRHARRRGRSAETYQLRRKLARIRWRASRLPMSTTSPRG